MADIDQDMDIMKYLAIVVLLTTLFVTGTSCTKSSRIINTEENENNHEEEAKSSLILTLDFGNVMNCLELQNQGSLDFAPLETILLSQYVAGDMSTISVQGDYAYVNLDKRLLIINIQNPTQPRLTKCIALPGYVSNLYVVDNNAFITTGNGYWYVLNITDPDNIFEIISGKNDSTRAPDFAIAGEYVYVIDADMGLYLINVSEPKELTEIILQPILESEGQLHMGLDFTYELSVVNQTAVYFAGFDHSSERYYIVILDISEPTVPKNVGFYKLPPNRQISGMVVSDGMAYVSTSYDDRIGEPIDYEPQILILDVSDPNDIFEVGLYENSATLPVVSISLYNDRLYLAEYREGLVILDISNPLSPTEIVRIKLPYGGDAIDIAVLANHAYAINATGVLHILDIADQTNIREVGSYTTLGPIQEFEVHEDIAYIVSNHLRLVNVSDPKNLTILGVSNADDFLARGVATANEYVYVSYYGTAENGYRESGIHIIKTTDPTNPVVAGTFRFSSFAYVGRMALDSEYVYLIGSSGLHIIDVSLPEKPVAVGVYEKIDSLNPYVDVAVWGNYVYVTNASEGLLILDISNPIQPREVGEYQSENPLYEITIWEGFAYVNTSLELLKLDLSEPNNPREVKRYHIIPKARNLHAANDRLYVLLEDENVISLALDSPVFR